MLGFGEVSLRQWILLLVLSTTERECIASSEINLENKGLTAVPQIDTFQLDVNVIDLGGNEIVRLEAYAFSLPSVLSVKVNDNKIRFIDPFAFNGTLLNHLDVSNNELSTFPDLSVVGTTLKSLFMRDNNIADIPSNLSNGLSKLENLRLSGNPIETFPNLTAAGNSLTYLNLGGARFSEVNQDDTDYFHSLEKLRISSGKQTRFPDLTAMPCVGTLQELELTSNQIITIDPSLMFPLVGLVKIDIRYNKLTNLPSLTPLRSLQKLNACGNYITSITAQHFEGLKHLELLDLSHNKITTFPSLSHLPNTLTNIELESNPLICDCHLKWMKGYVIKLLTTEITLGDKPCSAPEGLIGVQWAQISRDDMTCPCIRKSSDGMRRNEYTLQGKDARMNTDVVLQLRGPRSRLQCAVACTKNLDCWSFSYQPLTGNCIQSRVWAAGDANYSIIYEHGAVLYSNKDCPID